MKSYSQNAEDLFILNYFGNYKGTLLEVGANDGKTLSNSLLLIKNGWKAHLVEPGNVFEYLFHQHVANSNVTLHNYAIGGEFNKEATFYESAAHVAGGADIGLVSSLDFEETERWRKNGVAFTETKVQVKSFREFYKEAGQPKFDFISIDAEGFDWDILQQINLTEVGCKALCIEFNGIEALQVQFTNYCALHGLKLAHINNENLIFFR